MQHSSNVSHSKEVEGQLSIATLICNLFRTDLNPVPRAQGGHASTAEDIFLHSLAYYANRSNEVYALKPITKALTSKARNTLFHERIHYWQVMSCPLQQFRFVAALDRLRLAISRLGGKPDHLCGQIVPRAIYGSNSDAKIKFETALAPVYDSLKQADALFKAMPLTPQMIRLPNVISTEPYTDMPLISIPVDDSDTTELPGYGAILGFSEGDDVAAFPFNGRYLFESAAYASELLFDGKPLPRPAALRGNDEIYLGVWEFWRRLHASRYKSQEDLAIGFLAAVDLALTSDAIDVNPTDGEYEYEMFSLPYRFGKLAYGLQGLPPFELPHQGDPAKAVNDFQERICRYVGWPAPTFAVQKMMVFLTRVIFQSCARYIPASKDNEERIIQLFTTSDFELPRNVDKLKDVWDLIDDARPRLPVFIGMHILGAMLNACKYRVEFPGRFALPHIYNESLAEEFPLPILQMDGEYYLDEIWGTMVSNPAQINWPYRIDPIGLLDDCIALLSIRPVQMGSGKCGFLEEIIDCWYIKNGLGCPQKSTGYTDKEQARRDKFKLEDWCHWTPRAVMLGYAAPEIQRRWRKRWASAAK
jgi:hypothetical protein